MANSCRSRISILGAIREAFGTAVFGSAILEVLRDRWRRELSQFTVKVWLCQTPLFVVYESLVIKSLSKIVWLVLFVKKVDTSGTKSPICFDSMTLPAESTVTSKGAISIDGEQLIHVLVIFRSTPAVKFCPKCSGPPALENPAIMSNGQISMLARVFVALGETSPRIKGSMEERVDGIS